MAKKRIITNPKFMVERDGDNWVLKFKDGNIYKPIEFNNAQLSGRKNRVITQPNFSIEFNDGVPSLLVNIDGVNVNVSNYVAPQPPTPPVPPEPTNRILYTVVEGGTQPTSTWINENCSDNVFDENTGEGYLVLNEGVTELAVESHIKNIFKDFNGDYNNIVAVVIPSQITSIGNYAFAHCRGLAHVTIPNSVTNIGQSAFFCCSGLTSITIPNYVTNIGQSAFASCSGLTSITIPNSVTSIRRTAFNNCSGLTSVTISNTVTDIAELAFNGCTSLASVTCFATTPPTLGRNAFGNINTTTCGVPEASISTYEKHASWSAVFTTFVAADMGGESK